MYIANQDDLIAFCDRAQAAKLVCLDTEFIRERTLYPNLCLIQLSIAADDIAVIDPCSSLDLSPVIELFADGTVAKVAHAAGQDVEAIYHTFHVIPEPLFDTQVAASFLGHRMQPGYGALVESVCHVRLPKSESLSDWTRRPLDPEQLAYAEDDVRYLPEIYVSMVAELTRKDRLSWVLPEMEGLVDPKRLETDPEEAYLHLKRVTSLSKRQLGVAAEVCAWRERQARARDIPRKWVISDELVAEICRRFPRSTDRLSRIRGSEKLSEADKRAIVDAVARGLKRDDVSFPKGQHHGRGKADTESIVDLMNAMLRIISEREGIAVQLIATHDDLLDLISDRDRGRLSEGWRREVAGAELGRLLDGEVGLTVKDGRIQIL